ncbi:hypothetical protein CU098_001860 [Rhizopus stolonifer]|uniref:HMG box domain-containing protein n=1 Tax=Rhizopus stolonifer TaxID=4846 RepID=A0A367KQX9_RHIST|nr:hypothetical protein CU098_001860 [Rhizopus stolonifer]
MDYPTFNASSYFLPSIAPFLPLQNSKQWKKDVSQSALIINEEKAISVSPSPPPPLPPPSSQPPPSLHIEQSDDIPPTHIVSPEAIREALKEEKEEAMGNSQRRPFSQFVSFHALKQRQYSTDPCRQPVNQDMDEKQTKEPLQSDSKKQEKPKRPPNAYLLFNRDMRRKLLEVSPKMTVAEISKEVGDWWKMLPKDQREFYVKEASLLKEEHLKKHPNFIYTRRSKAELAEAKRTSRQGKKSLKSNSPELVVVDKKQAKKSCSEAERDPRGRKKKRHKHPFAPKHPMSAYLHYLASVYPQVSLNFPGSTVGPISKTISRTWHAMSPEERLPWKQKAESDKARYAREMQTYMAKQKEKENRLSDKEDDDDDDDDEYKEDMDAQALSTVVNMVNNNCKYNV